jgi:hypothetical protein
MSVNIQRCHSRRVPEPLLRVFDLRATIHQETAIQMAQTVKAKAFNFRGVLGSMQN